MNTTRLLAPLLLISAACSSTGSSRALPPAEFAPIAGDDGVLVWSAGADAWFVDPKDKELHSALSMVDTRLAELPDEIEEPDFPLDALLFGLDVMASPMSLRLALKKDAQPGQLPYRAQLTVEPRDGEDSAAMAERLSTILTQYGVPSLGKSEEVHGLQMVPLGPMSAYHGALGNELVIAVNDVSTDMPKLGSLDLPESVRPIFAFKVDYRQIGDAMAQAMQFAAASAGEDADASDAAMAGMMWMKDTTVQGGMGYGADRLYGASRTQNYVTAAKASNLFPSRPLTEREIAMIPSDATWAAIWCMNPQGIMTVMRQAIAAQVKEKSGADIDPFAMVEAFTGFDIEEDLFDTLGETAGAYTSDTTGGGGWTSLVAFSAVKDEKKMRETIAWAESELNSLAAAQADSYVALRVRHIDGQHISTLTFPGLPIPVELSYALANGYVYFALSPQALLAAIEQAKEGHDGLASNARFVEVAGKNLEDLYSLSFIDTPRFLRDGYSLVGMGCAALDNALRSKSDAARDPGIVLPSYPAIEKGSKAFAQLGRIDGDDMVVTWQADRSMLVNACGVSGLIGGVNGVAAMLMPIVLLPKIMEAEQAAKARKALEEATELEDESMGDEDDVEEAMDELEEMMDEVSPPQPAPNDPH
jgi:hypothetical protein